jgi:2-polyprenyl-3-methyl-5-hydroxy-6-metoxy-1,4-benzoquinol methylase
MTESAHSGLAYTGERFVPGQGGARIAYEHYHRYFLAQRLATGKVVLDLGCGEGYGANILAGVARSVAGIDLSTEAIEHARVRYPEGNLKFVAGDCRDTHLPANHFDLVVCFEMIEHIAEHDQLLSEVRRVLKPDGVFIVSSPDKSVYSDAGGYENPFHVKELYAQEVQTLLQGHFSHVALFLQKVCTGSLLYQNPANSEALRGELMEAERSPDGTFQARQEPGSGAKYVVGVCSNAPLEPAVRSLALSVWNDAGEALVTEMDQHHRELQDSTEKLTQHLRAVEGRVRELEQQVGDLEGALREKSENASHLAVELAQQKARTAAREQELLAKDRHIMGLQQANAPLIAFEQKVKKTLVWKSYRAIVKPFKNFLKGPG